MPFATMAMLPGNHDVDKHKESTAINAHDVGAGIFSILLLEIFDLRTQVSNLPQSSGKRIFKI